MKSSSAPKKHVLQYISIRWEKKDTHEEIQARQYKKFASCVWMTNLHKDKHMIQIK